MLPPPHLQYMVYWHKSHLSSSINMHVSKKLALGVFFSSSLLLMSGCAYHTLSANPPFYENVPKQEAMVEACAANHLISNELNEHIKSQLLEIKTRLRHDRNLYLYNLTAAREDFRHWAVSDLYCKEEDLIRLSAEMDKSISELRYAASWFTPEAVFGTAETTSAKWDEITNEYGNRVWACRDVNNGQFTELRYCQNQSKIDNWPQS